MNPNWLKIEKDGNEVILKKCSKEAEGEFDGLEKVLYEAFLARKGITAINIPDSVTKIGPFAFDGCSDLTTINIPDSVTEIGNNAFMECLGLTEITIPNSVTSIGGGAFYGCSGLTSVTIGNGVTSIGDSAFDGCRSLEGIVIPKSVTSIGDYAFAEYMSPHIGVLDYVLIGNPLTIIGENAFGNGQHYKPWVQIENIPSGCYALFCKNDVDFLQIPSYIKKIVSSQVLEIRISVLDFAGEISETDGDVFADCKINKLRINTPRKQTIIPEDIKRALDNTKFSDVVYAVPELCNEESPVSGYIRCTLEWNDELVDINTKYILSVEPFELDCYHPHTGSRIRCAVCGVETHYDYIVYEPCDMVLKKIEHSLCQLSERVGGIAGLLNQIETLANDKCSNK